MSNTATATAAAIKTATIGPSTLSAKLVATMGLLVLCLPRAGILFAGDRLTARPTLNLSKVRTDRKTGKVSGGKTHIVATTGGFQDLPGAEVDGHALRASVTAYVYPKQDGTAPRNTADQGGDFKLDLIPGQITAALSRDMLALALPVTTGTQPKPGKQYAQVAGPTGGNVRLPIQLDGQDVVLNCYVGWKV